MHYPRLLPALLLLLCSLTLNARPAAGQVLSGDTPTTPTKYLVGKSTLEIEVIAPERVQAGFPFVVQLTLPPEVGQHYTWIVSPQPATPPIEMLSRTGQPMLFVQGITRPTEIGAFAQIPADGLDPIGRHSVIVSVGSAPDPRPDPDPRPEPEPEPEPQPVGPYWVIVLEESAERTPETAAILNNGTFLESLKAAGHKLRTYDDDHANASAFAALTTHRPALIVTTMDGTIVHTGPMPKTVQGVLDMLKGGK